MEGVAQTYGQLLYVTVDTISYCTYLNNLQHFHSCDLAVSIQVIHVEGPIEFLFETASGCNGQSTDKLSEVDGAVSIFVEGPKCMLGKFWCITIRKKLKEMWKGIGIVKQKQQSTSTMGLNNYVLYNVVW